MSELSATLEAILFSSSRPIKLREVLLATPALFAAREIIVAAVRTNHGNGEW